MSSRPRVLIADDHSGIVTAARRLLAFDCDVVGTVADGSILLETAQRLQPDVIVLDLHLPKVNGLEACRQIIRANPNMKVVIFTGVNDDYVSQAAFAAGASAFVCKLTAGDQLLAAIKRLSADGNRTNRDTL